MKKHFYNNEIKLINPLLSDYSNLRSSLLPNLIKTVQENLKQGNHLLKDLNMVMFFREYSNKFSRKRICCWYIWWYKNKINLVRF
jgi:phenylalanyl-tRNA synthetase beta subunit